MSWSWWPAADGGPWEWAWHAYPGVWLFLLAMAGAYAGSLRLLGPRWLPAGEPRVSRARVLLFALGLVVLWVAVDWPLGPLAAGYLVNLHAAQYLLISLAAAPLLLLGTPGWLASAAVRARPARAVATTLTHPLLAIAVFAGVLVLTHLPVVLDTLRPESLGDFGLVIAWLGAALLLWWPVVGPAPEMHRLPYLAGLGYLVLPFIVPKGPGAFFIFADTPLYEVYAAAPPVWGLSPLRDQQLAGSVLWVIGSVMVMAALAVLFFRWHDEDRRMAAATSLAIPASPRALELLFEVPGAWPALQQLLVIVDEAFPASQSGAQLGFTVREQGGGATGDGPQVVLELRAALAGEVEAMLAERIEREYAAYLDRSDVLQRAAIARRLSFRIVGYGGRVG